VVEKTGTCGFANHFTQSSEITDSLFPRMVKVMTSLRNRSWWMRENVERDKLVIDGGSNVNKEKSTERAC
jgi:hypothetical protein